MAVYGNVENIDAIILAEVMAGARHIDGFSPIVETERTVNGEKVTITDKYAEHIFEILNGTALSARVEGKKAIFETDGSEYQPRDIADEAEHFTDKTVEGALSELAERCSDLETEQTTPRAVEYGGTGADNAEDARANLGLAFDSGTNYVKLPDGTLIQWGVRGPVSVSAGTISVDTITYSVPFLDGYTPRLIAMTASSQPQRFSLGIANGNGSHEGKVNIYYSGTGTSEAYYYWIAISRWKEVA